LDAEKIIAIFTVILGVTTGFLWLATRSLVGEARQTGERQLRGYLSVTPKTVATSAREERFVQIFCIVKNHGQTPVREINFVFEVDFLPNPLATGFVFPNPSIPIAMAATLFPQMEMDNWFNFDRTLTVEEFEALEKDLLRLHIWGKAFYTTAFGESCFTEFKASVGGRSFVADLRATRRKQQGPGFKWEWGEGHGYGN
jgi:hypothetical protein